MTIYTATINVPLKAKIPTRETTETAINDFIYETTESALRKLESTGQWKIENWGWVDVWPGEEKGTNIVLVEGCLSTTEHMEAETVLEVFDFFTENYSIPHIALEEWGEQPEEFFVSKVTDGENTHLYDERGFITYASEWKTGF